MLIANTFTNTQTNKRREENRVIYKSNLRNKM